MSLLEIKNLSVSYQGPQHSTDILNNINVTVLENEIVGITGESGSGKSMLAWSLLGLHNQNDTLQTTGSVKYKNLELINKSEKEWSKIRNKSISIIFQNPEAALNAVIKCGKQVGEAIARHQPNLPSHELSKKVKSLIVRMGFDDVDRIITSYPHELSGGQQQRIVIAIAIANDPDVIIADEATSSLDRHTSNQIIQILTAIKNESKCAIIFITHDIQLLKKIADRIVLLENGQVHSNFINDETAISSLDEKTKAYFDLTLPLKNQMPTEHNIPILLSLDGITKIYNTKKYFFQNNKNTVLDDIQFVVHQGTMLGVLGKTGSGKSTLGKILTGVVSASTGKVHWLQKDVNTYTLKNDKILRRSIQLLMQDSYTSFDPLQSVESILEEIISHYHLASNPLEKKSMILKSLEEVGLSERLCTMKTTQLSGGQRQRLSIARTLLLKPNLLIFDESLSALDIKNQIQIIELLNKLKNEYDFTGIFISHDPVLIQAVCDEVIILDNGKIVDHGMVEEVFNKPKHAATRLILKLD